jgi:hypothetical protein
MEIRRSLFLGNVRKHRLEKGKEQCLSLPFATILEGRATISVIVRVIFFGEPDL